MIDLVHKSRVHLHEMKESYWEHFSFAMVFSLRLIGAGLAVLIHALIPALFQFTGSKSVMALNEILKERANPGNHG